MFSYFALPGTMAFITIMHKSKQVGDWSEKDVEKKAICVLNPEPKQTAKGIVHFEQKNNYSKTFIHGKFTGLSKNSLHGFHIHSFGNLSQGCVTAGPHYNPVKNILIIII